MVDISEIHPEIRTPVRHYNSNLYNLDYVIDAKDLSIFERRYKYYRKEKFEFGDIAIYMEVP